MRKMIVVMFSLISPFFLERFLSGYLEKGIQYIVSNEHFYSNWVYRRIAEGVRVNLGFYIILIIIIYFSIVFIINHNNKKRDTTCKGKCKKCDKEHTFHCVFRKLYDWYNHSDGYMGVVFAIVIVTATFLSLTNFINHTMIRITNNIDIIAPYITDQEYKYLRSDFKAMNNYNDFCELSEKLNLYAADNNIVLK